MKYNIIRTISLYDMYQNKHTNSHTAKLYCKTLCQASPDKPKDYELVTLILNTSLQWSRQGCRPTILDCLDKTFRYFVLQ